MENKKDVEIEIESLYSLMLHGFLLCYLLVFHKRVCLPCQGASASFLSKCITKYFFRNRFPEIFILTPLLIRDHF